MSNIQDIITDELQYYINEYQSLNVNTLEQMTKLTDYTSKLNYSIIKSCTRCRCIQIDTSNHLADNTHGCIGKLCPECIEKIEKNMGGCIYYLASLCNTFDLNLYDILIKELNKLTLLGKYHIK